MSASPPRVHALTPEGRAILARFVARAPLLAFDIDGTLAPIVARPEDARIPDALQDALASLAAIAPVAILTGRGRDDARGMVRFEPAYVLGNHGIEGLPGFEARTRTLEATSAAWRDALARDGVLADAGVLLEDKRYSLALHFRDAPDHALAERTIAAQLAALDPAPKIIGGKCVVNVLPAQALTKGDALRALLESVPSGCAFYAGDDDTDEHVFDLPDELVLGVRVGERAGSNAQLFIDDPAQMLPVIELLASAWPAR